MKTAELTAEDLYERLKDIKVGTTCHYSLQKCAEFVPLINEINRLKDERHAIILVHSYVVPEIMYGVGDCVGDSYELSKFGRDSDADVIVFAAVRFMADTAKILSPQKTVLIPGSDPGCTLADSITGAQVKELRQQYPDYTFVCYINTMAEVKAECDVCVTSSNVYNIVEKIENDKIYFLPDKLMARNLINEMQARGVQKTIKYWDGICYVHKEYTAEDIFKIRTEYPEAQIVSHPECNEAVIKNSDYVGSTSQMLKYMETAKAKQFLMLTECGLSSRLQREFPDKQLVGSCTLCKYMKSNTLEGILRVLKNPRPEDEVRLSEDVIERAKACVEKMFYYVEKKGPSNEQRTTSN